MRDSHKTLTAFFILLVIALQTSCGDRIEREKLIGQYVFSTWNRDTIELNADGTYRNYTVDSGVRLENTGTWKLNGFNEVELGDFTTLTRRDGLKGLWISRLRKEGDEIHLMYATEENIYYKQVSKTIKVK